MEYVPFLKLFVPMSDDQTTGHSNSPQHTKVNLLGDMYILVSFFAETHKILISVFFRLIKSLNI